MCSRLREKLAWAGHHVVSYLRRKGQTLSPHESQGEEIGSLIERRTVQLFGRNIAIVPATNPLPVSSFALQLGPSPHRPTSQGRSREFSIVRPSNFDQQARMDARRLVTDAL